MILLSRIVFVIEIGETRLYFPSSQKQNQKANLNRLSCFSLINCLVIILS